MPQAATSSTRLDLAPVLPRRQFLAGLAAGALLPACQTQAEAQWVLGQTSNMNWLLRAYIPGVYLKLQLQLAQQYLPPLQLQVLEGWTSALFQLPAQLAGQTLAAQLRANDQTLGTARRIQLPVAAPASEHTLYIGSCLQKLGWFGREPILASIVADARQQPNPAMLWLGDHLYFAPDDLSQAGTMCRAYQRQRQHAALAELLTAMPNYAIWDDHDFGLNDADSSAPSAKLSAQVFPLMWANPPSPTPYFALQLGQVRLLFTDNRSARRGRSAPAYQRQLFGEAQLAWLHQQLLQRDVAHTLLLGGSQWWVGAPGEEGWSHAAAEQQRWRERLLQQPPASRLLYMSGDRHHSAEFTRQFGQEVVHELTTSALTSPPDPEQTGYGATQLRQFYAENNYLRVQIRGAALSWQWFGANGQPLGPVTTR
ncbi:alkaline phosphatase D family protein [Chitinibacter tainanensis]|uniref:alkaline phosphatase D family protein n=1 Tax=Chitinibacter tainanensis TaxID=230667 RepID=UPI00235386FB|nr:hypothetical protein [Chitinibacter tainanensis]